MSTDLSALASQIKSLSAAEQEQLRELLEREAPPRSTPMTEVEFCKSLAAQGILREFSSTSTLPPAARRRVDIQGKPLSHTVIEERD